MTEELYEERIKNLKEALRWIYGWFNKERSGMYKDMPELNYLGRSVEKIQEAFKKDEELAG